MTEQANKSKHRVNAIFMDTLKAYPVLGNYAIRIEFMKIRGATMNARPVLRLRDITHGISEFKIMVAEHVRDSSEIRVDELPEEVLTGWFAHELGHIMDYLGRSVPGMIWFGFRYLASDRFRRSSEHKADQYAIHHGFHNEIIAAKRFILEHDLLPGDYKKKITKYYMPIEQVRWHSENPHILDNLFTR